MGKSKKHDNKSKKKHKHKERKEKKKAKKHSKEKKASKEEKECKTREGKVVHITNEKFDDFSIPVELMSSKSHAPETPEEYRQRQSRIRREIDPVTGRSRLIKGDGEVIEEIVSKERHIAINREATKGDGEFFQENLISKRK